MKAPVLVTGAGGFIGSHLVATLRDAGISVGAWVSRGPCEASAASGLVLPDRTPDLRDPSAVDRAIAAGRPATVFHLAGVTSASRAADVPAMVSTNVTGTWSLLDALRRESPDARTVLIGSSAAYGPANGPLTEASPLMPVNEHGVSKAAQEMIAVAMASRHGLDLVRARTFNLVGPGEPEGLVCSAVARQIAAAELGIAEPMVKVGRLDTCRDFTDVRDAVAAYVVLCERGRRGEVYNICSGRRVGIGEVVERLMAMSRTKVSVQAQPQLHRRGDVDAQQGSAEKIRQETGWQPRISLDQSLADLLEWWRVRLGRRIPA